MSKINNYSIGVDIGGSNIKFVLLKNQEILKKKKVPTPKTKKEIISKIKENIKCLTYGVKQKEIKGIGIAALGPLNKKGDFILNPPNLKALKNCPLARILKKDFKHLPIVLENDANCFTLAEALIGEGKTASRLRRGSPIRAAIIFGITLGSGVGGGIVVNGKIYRGAFGGAGEVGHMTIKFDGQKCSCGNWGCLEEYCSMKFFKRKKVLPRELEERIKKGEKTALKIFEEYGENLGIGLSNIINILDPEIIVIGGGISRASNFFLPATKKEIKKRVISPLSKKCVKIRITKLGDFSGAIGAALLVKKLTATA